MALLTVQAASLAGGDLTLAAAEYPGGDTFPNDGRTVLVVKTSGTACDVTVNRTRNCSQGFDHNVVVSLGATAEKHIGPFPVDQFGTTVSVTYSTGTGVTVAARRTP